MGEARRRKSEVIKPGRILEATRRHRIRVDEDVLKEFTEKRR